MENIEKVLFEFGGIIGNHSELFKVDSTDTLTKAFNELDALKKAGISVEREAHYTVKTKRGRKAKKS